MTAAASAPFPLVSFDGIHELISCANDVVDRGGRVEKAGKTYAEIHSPPTRLHSDAQKGLKFAHYFFRWGAFPAARSRTRFPRDGLRCHWSEDGSAKPEPR